MCCLAADLRFQRHHGIESSKYSSDETAFGGSVRLVAVAAGCASGAAVAANASSASLAPFGAGAADAGAGSGAGADGDGNGGAPPPIDFQPTICRCGRLRSPKRVLNGRDSKLTIGSMRAPPW